MYVTSVLITSTVDPSKRYTRHVTLDGLHGTLCRHTQEEPYGKKSSIGSENRQRCSRRFRTSVIKAGEKILPSAPLCCVSCCVREEPSLRGGHGKSGSLIRSTALLPRSKLGTRHTPDDMYSPTRQSAKRCREPVAFAAADRGDRARRVRGDRHGEAAVIPYDAAGASARACGSVEGSTLGAAEVRRTAPLPHHPRLGAVQFI